MAKPAFLHFVCALLLLVAQHGALTHSVWHLHDHLPAHQQQDIADAAQHQQDGGHSSQSRLCDLHFALGTLLAGDCSGQPVPATTVLSNWLATSGAAGRVAQPATTPPSRAPPVLL
jgi:hypothetical protein